MLQRFYTSPLLLQLRLSYPRLLPGFALQRKTFLISLTNYSEPVYEMLLCKNYLSIMNPVDRNEKKFGGSRILVEAMRGKNFSYPSHPVAVRHMLRQKPTPKLF